MPSQVRPSHAAGVVQMRVWPFEVFAPSPFFDEEIARFSHRRYGLIPRTGVGSSGPRRIGDSFWKSTPWALVEATV